MVDEGYMVVGSHIDEVTFRKIERGEYVDFGKLIPRDKVLMEDDGRMEMIVKGGKTYWSPVSEAVTISNFFKWEQAFRVFANIYTKSHPHRSSELIEYNHIIHNISTAYVWDNVYTYDKDFRIHMGKNPSWSWAIILQQAWAMRLRDRINRDMHNGNSFSHNNKHNHDRGKPYAKEPCCRFNKGRCNFSANCKFEHNVPTVSNLATQF